MKIAVQMDPISSLSPKFDTTLALIEAAFRRGHTIAVYTPDTLSLDNGAPSARLTALVSSDSSDGNLVQLEPSNFMSLDEFDTVLMRQDPPFDMGYITATYLLEFVGKQTVVVNDPGSVRDAPEKIRVLLLPAFTPPTLISRDPDIINHFRAEHGDIVIKPLYGMGGRDVFLLKKNEVNAQALIESFQRQHREPWVNQKFLPDVKMGDKRILLVEGDPIASIVRIPKTGEIRSNMAVGGQAALVELTVRDREICEAMAPMLREAGIVFAGIDVIGQYVTEINITSPTGIRAVEAAGGPDVASAVIEAIERRVNERVGS